MDIDEQAQALAPTADDLLEVIDRNSGNDIPAAKAEGAEEAEAEEGADEEGDEQEGEGEEAPDVTQKFRVKVKAEDGSDAEEDLTLEELAAGYMRNKRFTVGTQQLAAQEKQRQEQFFSAVHQTTEQARNQLRALHQLVVSAAAPELHELTPQLAHTDPTRYVQLQAKQAQLQGTLTQLAQQDQQLQQKQQLVIQRQRDQAIQQSLDYLSREIPGFNLETAAPKLLDAGKKYGYTPQELSNVIDGRFLHMLHDAKQWRELQSQKPAAMKKVNEAPKVIRPSAPQPKKSNQSALDRLRKTGRASELVNFL